ncbi:MAG: ABC transporter permease [Bacteroidales bacterium]|nr:ABC transporter permease [Bacteroidales bacterium]
MKNLGNLYKKDFILGFKDVWILLELGASVLIMSLFLFVIPKNIETEASVFIFDQSHVLQSIMDKKAEKKKKTGQIFVDSREKVVKGITKNRAAVGMIISKNSDGQFHTELLTQPYTSEAMVQYFKVTMADLLAVIKPPAGIYPPDVYQSVEVTALQEGVRDDIPFNKRMVPLVLMFVVGFMGIFTMMSVIGQERAGQTIRAYKVTPSSLGKLLLSKHLLILTISFMTFSIIYLPLMGFDTYLKAMLVIMPTVLLGSAIGVILGTFFDNPMGAMGWVLLLMIIFGLPAVSLFAPIFSPDWLKFIPSYHTLFGLDAAMFPDNNSSVFWNEVLILFAIAAVLLPLSGWVFTNKLRKEI